MKKGKIIIFVGPSGVGKATIENKLFKIKKLHLQLSVSATTRKPRRNEIEGKNYYFISKKEFTQKVERNQFLEWSNHFNFYYGTLKSEVEQIINQGDNAFLEIETNGAIEIMKKMPKDELLTIFILPPSIEELRKRIILRNTESSLEIENRLKKAVQEISLQHLFDYVIVNKNVTKTVREIKNIILDHN